RPFEHTPRPSARDGLRSAPVIFGSGLELNLALTVGSSSQHTQHTTAGYNGQCPVTTDAAVSHWCHRPNKVTLMMEEEKKENQGEEPDSLTLQENSQETSHNGSALPASASKGVPMQSFISLLPKALSAVLHPTLPPHINSEPQPSINPPSLQQLQTDLRDLRDQFELMKSQHNKEIKLLMNELDEEKRIRLTLQMEIQRMKKHMSK
ncbi:hypothetical protein FQN60_000831, partial [Etheostoma spectabile]